MAPISLPTLERPAPRFAAAALFFLIALSAAVRTDARGLVRGEVAIAALGAAIDNTAPAPSPGAVPRPPPAIATERSQWESALRDDADLAFSPASNQLIYSCSTLSDDTGTFDNGTTILPAPLPTENTLSPDAAPADASGFALPKEQDPLAADAFRLHSRPGAPKKIVLDFTGHTLRAGTAWGADANKNGDVPIVTPPYDLDGDPASFSAAERAAIVSVWRQVAEDFAPWDVDVTTEEPFPGDDNAGDASLVGVGTRVAIGKNNGWFDNAGGVAFINGFGQQWSGPVAFVFNSNPANAAIAVSHEVGHTLGLGHHGTVAKPDGTGASEYYRGHGSWAPVMGVGYNKNVIQWSKGDYDFASKPLQNDLTIIGGKLAAAPWSGGSRDYNTAEAINVVPGVPSNVSGILLTGTESHFYKVEASGAGTMTVALSVNPRAPAGNSRTHLAAKVRVLRLADFSVVGTQFNNVGPTGIDGNVPDTSTMSFSLPASGTYFIEMAAARNGDAATGYTEYGSSGTYALSVVGGLLGGGNPPIRCLGATTLQLSSAAGNCNTGVAVRALDVYTTNDPTKVPTVSPVIGTVLAGGTSRVFTASLGSTTCTTTVTVTACPTGNVADVLTCRSPSYTLLAGSCSGISPPVTDLYALSPGAGSASTLPAGTATTTMPADGILGPGVHSITVRATVGTASCTATVRVTPCRPAAISTTTINSAPGVCAGTPAPSAVVTAATLGRGALSFNARTSATGSVLPAPLTARAYYVQVVYPGNLLSAISATTVSLGINDVEAPVLAIKTTVVRDAAGYICAKGIYSTSSTACISVSTASTGLVSQFDNCGTVTRSAFTCTTTRTGACPTTAPSASATRLCVNVKAGGGRTEAVFGMTVKDKVGRVTKLNIMVAGYHFKDAGSIPAGVTAYTA